jgi:predicted RND superfamily exporter protein
VQMALTGAAIGLGIATVVLFLSTRNLIITIACIGTIAAALTCVIGTVVAMGWSLGSNESLCIMILTGFAVDYVVHLSHAYMESSAKARLERVHDALRDLGISVFWGMLTSVLAAAVLASCQIQFFHKFGVFFALTILFAYLWSVLFLMPLLAIIGPEPAASEDVKFGDQATASGDK